MTDSMPPAVAALAAAAGVDPAVFADPAVAAYFDDIARAVAALGDAPPADPDDDAPFDPSWPVSPWQEGGAS